ncbi:MAG: acetylornithine/succinylornithine family transaminase [Defluviitaleaceae bacterium]|nr:acetylornithine/succinylornithine family transaminase [Defluviitaleaceae bacterium]
MKTKTLSELKPIYDTHISATYLRYPVAFHRGGGCRLYSPEGKEYIDFASGIGVSSVGHSHPKWLNAVNQQAALLTHVSNLYYTEPGAVLAEKLCQISGMKGVFFSNSGAESVEGAIKVARKYSHDKYGGGRHTILTLQNSFHGRTMAALTATGQPEKFHKDYFYPFVQGFEYVPANDFAAMEAYDKGTVCAVIIELVQGEGGVLPLCGEYVKNVAALCQKNDWLLIADEVQTGIGRVGHWFAYQNYGIMPDVVPFAKGIAGGLPFGGFLLGEKVRNTLGAGDHGTTYGANLVCAAAALAVLEILEPILPSIKEKGEYICEKIQAMNLPCVKEIRAKGLMLGVQLHGITPAHAVTALLENGLVALSAGADVLRFLPPLVIEKKDIDDGLAIMEKTLDKLQK